MNPIIISESVLFWAFRYCLGRRTYAVKDCVDAIVKNWNNLPGKTQSLIVTEIKNAISKGDAGMEMDIKQWRRVLQCWKMETNE